MPEFLQRQIKGVLIGTRFAEFGEMLLDEVRVNGSARPCAGGTLGRFFGRLAQTSLDIGAGLVNWHIGVRFEHLGEGLKVLHRSLGTCCQA